MKTESANVGKRLIDVWDFHWYAQGAVGGQLVEYVDANASTAART